MGSDYTDLKGTGKGRRCICWAHGKSADNYRHAPIGADTDILTINHTNYAPFSTFFLAHDDDIWYQVKAGGIVIEPETIIISPVNREGHYHYHFDRTPTPTTMRFSHYRSGLRAVYLASEIMQYDEVYLVGYDYILHPKAQVTADIRTWESRQLPWDPSTVLDEQIEEFADYGKWRDNIFQTNQASRLQQFPVRKYRAD